jgi:hypothetical protein
MSVCSSLCWGSTQLGGAPLRNRTISTDRFRAIKELVIKINSSTVITLTIALAHAWVNSTALGTKIADPHQLCLQVQGTPVFSFLIPDCREYFPSFKLAVKAV